MKETDARVFLCTIARDVSGLYIWGAESESEGGVDCSGYTSVVLTRGARVIPGLYDGVRRTSRGIFDYYRSRGAPIKSKIEHLLPGSIVFYNRGRGTRIFHVAIHLFNLDRVRASTGPGLPIGPVAIESGGGGSRTTTPRDALIASAGVRQTATDHHGRGVEWLAVDPIALLDL